MSDQDRILKLIEELGRNPDSPLGLQIQSQANAAFARLEKVCKNLVQALVEFEENPTEDNRNQVLLMIDQWECMHGEEQRVSMPEEVLHTFENEAKELLKEKQRRPPDIETILTFDAPISDMEYDLIGGLSGVKGTFHRLWSSISTLHSWTELNLPGKEAYDELVHELRTDLETKLKRKLTGEEYERLKEAAHWHSANIGIPFLKEMQAK